MSDLSNLRRPEGAHRASKRLGRGPGSGLGTTSGKGHKGQKARTGHHGIPAWFEGGQMPLQRRLPKRGFKNPFRKEYEAVNVRDLNKIDADTVTPDLLRELRLVGGDKPIKILGSGEITRKLTVQAHAFSASARAKIEAAGGAVELLED